MSPIGPTYSTEYKMQKVGTTYNNILPDVCTLQTNNVANLENRMSIIASAREAQAFKLLFTIKAFDQNVVRTRVHLCISIALSEWGVVKR